MQNNQPKKRGRKPGSKKVLNVTALPSIIDFSKVETLENLDIDPKMMEVMKSGSPLDELISYEGGIPRSTNIMVTGDPGIGKTTILLDLCSGLIKNGYKCLFISAEMQRKQMFKYKKRFPQFENIPTLFTSDYTEYNTKDVIEQILNKGWDVVLIDSIAEVMDGVREDNKWDRKLTESWFVEMCVKQNKGQNQTNAYTSFLDIQQVTKGGVFVGSNKLKHLIDASAQIKKGKSNTSNYIFFDKNRNGNADINFTFQISNDQIYYGTIVKIEELEEFVEGDEDTDQ